MLTDILLVKGSRPTKLAVEVRDLVECYVTSMHGSLPWQRDHASWGVLLYSDQNQWT